MPFSAKHRRTETPWLDAQLEPLEAELGDRLAREAEQLAEWFPPDPKRVLSGLGLDLARQGGIIRYRSRRWPWAATAGLMAALLVASWLLVPGPREARFPVTQREEVQPALHSLTLAEGERLSGTPTAPGATTSETLQEEHAPAWLLSSEELEGIADLEQPGFALGI